jgi:hypothetical protein
MSSKIFPSPPIPPIVTRPDFLLSLKGKVFFSFGLGCGTGQKNQSWAIDDYHTMAAYKRHYPYFNIMEGDRLLQAYDRFMILDDFKNFRWFELKIRPDARVKFTRLSDTLILVEKFSPKK